MSLILDEKVKFHWPFVPPCLCAEMPIIHIGLLIAFFMLLPAMHILFACLGYMATVVLLTSPKEQENSHQTNMKEWSGHGAVNRGGHDRADGSTLLDPFEVSCDSPSNLPLSHAVEEVARSLELIMVMMMIELK